MNASLNLVSIILTLFFSKVSPISLYLYNRRVYDSQIKAWSVPNWIILVLFFHVGLFHVQHCAHFIFILFFFSKRGRYSFAIDNTLYSGLCLLLFLIHICRAHWFQRRAVFIILQLHLSPCFFSKLLNLATELLL